MTRRTRRIVAGTLGTFAVLATLVAIAWPVGARIVESRHIERLASGDEGERHAAALALAKTRSRRGLDALVRVLREQTCSRPEVPAGRGTLGREFPTAVPNKPFQLPPDELSWAREAFALYGKNGIEHLIQMLEDDDRRIKAVGAKLLRHVGADAVPQLVDRFCGVDLESARRSAHLLLSVGWEPLEPYAPRVAAVLRHEDFEMRALAVQIIGKGRGALEYLDALRSALDDDCSPVVVSAAGALGRIGPAAAPALESLEVIAADSECPSIARAAAVRAIGQIGSDAELRFLKRLLYGVTPAISGVHLRRALGEAIQLIKGRVGEATR